MPDDEHDVPKPRATVVQALADEARALIRADEPVPRSWLKGVAGEVATGLLTDDRDRQAQARAALRRLLDLLDALDRGPSDPWVSVVTTLAEVTSSAARLATPHMALEPGRLPARLLTLICAKGPIFNDEAMADLGLTDDPHGPTKMSRAAAKLTGQGLLMRRAAGRTVLWESTGRGRDTAEALAALTRQPA